jgi:hypothetical protein
MYSYVGMARTSLSGSELEENQKSSVDFFAIGGLAAVVAALCILAIGFGLAPAQFGGLYLQTLMASGMLALASSISVCSPWLPDIKDSSDSLLALYRGPLSLMILLLICHIPDARDGSIVVAIVYVVLEAS